MTKDSQDWPMVIVIWWLALEEGSPDWEVTWEKFQGCWNTLCGDWGVGVWVSTCVKKNRVSSTFKVHALYCIHYTSIRKAVKNARLWPLD